jgi:hypothetical protein
MVYNSYMIADCNFRNSTPNEKLSYALREMMLILEPINIL